MWSGRHLRAQQANRQHQCGEEERREQKGIELQHKADRPGHRQSLTE